jgi:hypothetical protein
MSDLTDALNRIMAWIERHYPDAATGFQPGLTYATIAEKLSTLPYHVPQEVYELYGWRNGDSNEKGIFECLYMLDLDRACEYSKSINDGYVEMREQNGEPAYLFCMFDLDFRSFAVEGCETVVDTTHVFHVDDVAQVRFAFTSLTSMMLTIAECYEAGIYMVNEDAANSFHLEMIDEDKFEEICRKYNPGIVKPLYNEY